MEYKESELSGLQGTTTILKFVDSGEIKLKRFGNQTSDMVFAKGKRFKTKYRTEYGTMSMEILTKDISVDILENPFDVRAVIQYDKTKLSETDLISVIEKVGDGDTYKVIK